MIKLAWDKYTDRLIPVIVQDRVSKTVLMQAYISEEALRLTLETGDAHYFSRSRNEIWRKGARSGNTQKIIKVIVDCDCDSLLYIVDQKGNACHTGEYSCYYTEIKSSDL